MPVGYPTNAFFYKGEWYNTDGEGVPATVVTNTLTGGSEILGPDGKRYAAERLVSPSGLSSGDSAEIQAAIDDVATYGGVVRLSAGLFDLATTITMRSHVTLRGSGAQTVLKQRGGAENAGRQNCITASGATDFVIADMTIDGNKSGQPGIVQPETDAVGNCVRLHLCSNFRVTGCVIKDAPYHGIIGTGESGELVGGVVAGNKISGNGYRSVHFHGTGYATGGGTGATKSVLVSGNVFHNNSLGVFAIFSRGGGFAVSDNIFYDEPTLAIDVEGYNETLGEITTDASEYNLIANNVMRNVGKAIRVQNAARKLLISENVIFGSLTEPAILIAGTAATSESCADITVRGGLIGNASVGVALGVKPAFDVAIEGVTIVDGVNGITVSNAATGTNRLRICGNKIRRMTQRGIQTSNGGTYKSVTIADNEFHKCLLGAGDINGLSRFAISRNRVVDCFTTNQNGFFVASSTGGRMDNNDIWHETAGGTGSGINLAATSSNINGSGNLITVGGTAIVNNAATSAVS